MHRLILLRHAHADNAAPGAADRDRALSAIGREEAAAAARWLATQEPGPSRVVCSDARRAVETCTRVLADLAPVTQVGDARIYDATPGTLIEIAEEHRDADCVLMIGHNPGFEQLAALLASGQTGDYRGMPPAGIAVIDLPAGAALEPGAGRLAAFWSP